MNNNISNMNSIRAFLFASIDRERGRFLAPKGYLMYGACAVAVFEMVKQGKLKCDGKNVLPVSSTSVGSEMFDEVYKVIISKGSPYKIMRLVSAVPYKVKGFSRRLMEDLEDNGLIRLDQGRFLGLIPYNRYVVTNTGAHEKLANELRSIVKAGNREAEPDDAFLISLLYVCRVLRRLFLKDEKKELRETFRKIGTFAFFENLDDRAVAVLKAVKAAIAAAEAAAT